MKDNFFRVSAITDISKEKCQGYPGDVKVVGTAREVAEVSDVVVTGRYLLSLFYHTHAMSCDVKRWKRKVDYSRALKNPPKRARHKSRLWADERKKKNDS